jgi:hypothetical protein
MKYGLILLLLMMTCQSDEDINLNPGADYIVFGQFYGYCLGESCIEIFKFSGADLFEDTLDKYPNRTEFYTGAFTKITRTDYAGARELLLNIPERLLDDKTRVIGMPDAGDWGGVYFEIKTGSRHDFWLIDKMRHNVPEEIIPFVDKIEKVILKINS